METHFNEFETKMRQAGQNEAIIRAFRHSYAELTSGTTGAIHENDIDPVKELPTLESLSTDAPDSSELLSQTVILKLNGGLGTGMGLSGPKSLLPVRDGLSFLDIIARHILHIRDSYQAPLRFMLMNSFSTSDASLAALQQYPELGTPADLELMQNSVPKVDASSLRPAEWPANPELEWCPPGHGDLYCSLLGSGWLERLLDAGVRYMFTSNADNLGASLDLRLLEYFAHSKMPFLMEVCERTAADRKGGHLAKRGGQLLLREGAQCAREDEPAFQDIQTHRFFNTNNLWIQLERLKQLLDEHGGIIPLPVIRNTKTVDPRDATSPKVIQLETAMGAAIQCFPDSGAIVVPRSRFAPVKTTSDLLGVRSDAYRLTDDWRVELVPERKGQPPKIDLDAQHYKLVDQLDQSLLDGVPSLARCASLTIEGPVQLDGNIAIEGEVTIINPGSEPKPLASGTYRDQTVEL